MFTLYCDPCVDDTVKLANYGFKFDVLNPEPHVTVDYKGVSYNSNNGEFSFDDDHMHFTGTNWNL